jgi:thioredoxin 2
MSSDIDLVTCPRCGASNRVLQERLDRNLEPTCGRCGAVLSASDAPVQVSDETFEREVRQSRLPVLVDLWAPWCAPCRMIAPTLEALARELSGRLRVAKVNVDENPATADRLGVQGIPTLLVFRDGREVDRIVGALPKSALMRRLQALV